MKKRTNAYCSASLSLTQRLPGYFFQKLLFFSLIILLSIGGVQAQNKIHVNGIVKDEKGTPTANASVTVKGSTVGGNNRCQWNFFYGCT